MLLFIRNAFVKFATALVKHSLAFIYVYIPFVKLFAAVHKVLRMKHVPKNRKDAYSQHIRKQFASHSDQWQRICRDRKTFVKIR